MLKKNNAWETSYFWSVVLHVHNARADSGISGKFPKHHFFNSRNYKAGYIPKKFPQNFYQKLLKMQTIHSSSHHNSYSIKKTTATKTANLLFHQDNYWPVSTWVPGVQVERCMELFHDWCDRVKGGWDLVAPMGLKEWQVQWADHNELYVSYMMLLSSCQVNSCKLQLMNLLQHESVSKSPPAN